ncbi:MAG: LptF/LptG family permease, partial [Rickettsiales bacterium]
MKLSLTLSTYIGRQVFYSIMITLGVLLAIGGFADLVELIRRIAEKPNVGFSVALEMSFMRLPYLAEQLMPYAILIGGMLALAKLTRTQELVVVRAAGVSVWQFLMPGALLGVILGIFIVGLFDPVASAMLARYERLESRYISGNASLL